MRRRQSSQTINDSRYVNLLRLDSTLLIIGGDADLISLNIRLKIIMAKTIITARKVEIRRQVRRIIRGQMINGPARAARLVIGILMLLRRNEPLENVKSDNGTGLNRIASSKLRSLLIATILIMKGNRTGTAVPIDTDKDGLIRMLIDLISVMNTRLPYTLLMTVSTQEGGTINENANALRSNLTSNLAISNRKSTPARINIIRQLNHIITNRMMNKELNTRRRTLTIARNMTILKRTTVLLNNVSLDGKGITSVRIANLRLLMDDLRILSSLRISTVSLNLITVMVIRLLRISLLAVLPLTIRRRQTIASQYGVRTLSVKLNTLKGQNRDQIENSRKRINMDKERLSSRNLVIKTDGATRLNDIANGRIIVTLSREGIVKSLKETMLNDSNQLNISRALPARLRKLKNGIIAIIRLNLLSLRNRLNNVIINLRKLTDRQGSLTLLNIVENRDIGRLVLSLDTLILLSIMKISTSQIISMRIRHQAKLEAKDITALLTTYNGGDRKTHDGNATGRNTAARGKLIRREVDRTVLLVE